MDYREERQKGLFYLVLMVYGRINRKSSNKNSICLCLSLPKLLLLALVQKKVVGGGSQCNTAEGYVWLTVSQT